MLQISMFLLGLATLTHASNPTVFAVEAPVPPPPQPNATVAEPLPIPEKMTLSEYFHTRMRLLNRGQVHQRHTLLTPAELARDFNNWDSGSDELEATQVHRPVRRRLRQKSRVRASSISRTTTTTTSTSTTTTEASVLQSPRKPLSNAVYSSSLDAMMNKQPEQSAAGSFGSRRVIPVNWEDELTEWDPPMRSRHNSNIPGRNPAIFEGGGGGLDPSVMNSKRKYTHTNSFRRKRPKFQSSSSPFSLERRPGEYEGPFGPPHTQVEVPSSGRFESFDDVSFGGDPTSQGGNHPSYVNDPINFIRGPSASEGPHHDFRSDFNLNDPNSLERFNSNFESGPAVFGDPPSTFGSSFRGLEHGFDGAAPHEDHDRSNQYIQFDSNEPPPNAEGIIPHASPELRWEDGTIINTNDKKFEKLGIETPRYQRPKGSLDLNRLPFLGPVQPGGLEFGKGVSNKDYKDPTENFDLNEDKPIVHHPLVEKSPNGFKHDINQKKGPGFHHNMETIILPWDGNDKDGLNKKIEGLPQPQNDDKKDNFGNHPLTHKDSTIFYLDDENKNVDPKETFVDEGPKVTVIYGPLIEDGLIIEEPEENKDIQFIGNSKEQNKLDPKEQLKHHQVETYIKLNNEEENKENEDFKKTRNVNKQDRFENHRYEPSLEQEEKNAEEKRFQSSEKTYEDISEFRDRDRQWKNRRDHDTSDGKADESMEKGRYDISGNKERKRKLRRNYDISGEKEDRRKINRNYDDSNNEDRKKLRRNYDTSDDRDSRRKQSEEYGKSANKEERRKHSEEYDKSANKEGRRKHSKEYYDLSKRDDERTRSWENSPENRKSNSPENLNLNKGYQLYDHFPKPRDTTVEDVSREAKLRPASRYRSQEIEDEKLASVEKPYYSSKFGSGSSEKGASRRSSPKSRSRGSRDPEVDDLSVHHIAGPPYHDAIPLDVVKAVSQEKGAKVVTEMKTRKRPKAPSSYAVDELDGGRLFRYDKPSKSREKDKSILVPSSVSRETKDPFRRNKGSKKELSDERHFGEVIEIFPHNVDYSPPKRKPINVFDEVEPDVNDEFYSDYGLSKEGLDFANGRDSDSKFISGDDFEEDFGRPPTFDFSFSTEHFNDAYFDDFEPDYSSEDTFGNKFRPGFSRLKNRGRRRRRRRFPKRNHAGDFGHPRSTLLRVTKPPSPPRLPTPALRLPERVHKVNGLEIYRVPTTTRNKDLIAIKINEFPTKEDTPQPSGQKFGQRLPRESTRAHLVPNIPRLNRLHRGRRRGPSSVPRIFSLFSNNVRRSFQEDGTDSAASPLDSDVTAYDNYDYNPEDDGDGLQNDRLTKLSLLNVASNDGWNGRHPEGEAGVNLNGNEAAGRRNNGQWNVGELLDLKIPGHIGRNFHRMFG